MQNLMKIKQEYRKARGTHGSSVHRTNHHSPSPCHTRATLVYKFRHHSDARPAHKCNLQNLNVNIIALNCSQSNYIFGGS